MRNTSIFAGDGGGRINACFSVIAPKYSRIQKIAIDDWAIMWTTQLHSPTNLSKNKINDDQYFMRNAPHLLTWERWQQLLNNKYCYALFTQINTQACKTKNSIDVLISLLTTKYTCFTQISATNNAQYSSGTNPSSSRARAVLNSINSGQNQIALLEQINTTHINQKKVIGWLNLLLILLLNQLYSRIFLWAKKIMTSIYAEHTHLLGLGQW